MTLHTSSNSGNRDDNDGGAPTPPAQPQRSSNRPPHTGRPTDRVVPSDSADQGSSRNFSGDCIAQPNGTDVSASVRPRSYATAAKARAIRTQLSDRDLAIVQTIAMVRVATSRHIETLHFSDLKSSSKPRQRSAVLSRLTKLGILTRLPRQIGGIRAGSSGYVFALDTLGQRILGRQRIRRPPTPSWPYLAHALAVTDLYISAAQAEQDGRLDFLRFTPEPHCWSLVEGELPLRPDAIVTVKPAVAAWTDHWAIEVDLASERPIRIRAKLLTYWEAFQAGGVLKGTNVFPKVLLTVPDEKRLHECLRVIEQLPVGADELVEIVLHDQAAKLLASGGPL